MQIPKTFQVVVCQLLNCQRVCYTLAVWQFTLFAACRFIRICRVVHGPEKKGGFGLEKKTKAGCDLERANYIRWFAECATPYNRPSLEVPSAKQIIPSPPKYSTVLYKLQISIGSISFILHSVVPHACSTRIGLSCAFLQPACALAVVSLPLVSNPYLKYF